MGLFKELADESLYEGDFLETDEDYIDPNQLTFKLDLELEFEQKAS